MSQTRVPGDKNRLRQAPPRTTSDEGRLSKPEGFEILKPSTPTDPGPIVVASTSAGAHAGLFPPGGSGDGAAPAGRGTPVTAMLDHALGYAVAGVLVFPCKPGAKEPACAHGFKDATTDTATIRRWWAGNPHANLAIATGAPGPDVLDVDVRDDGDGYGALDQLDRAGLLTGGFTPRPHPDRGAAPVLRRHPATLLVSAPPPP